MRHLLASYVVPLKSKIKNQKFPRRGLEGPATVLSQGGLHGLQEVEGGELDVGDGGPVGLHAEVLAILEPIGEEKGTTGPQDHGTTDAEM